MTWHAFLYPLDYFTSHSFLMHPRYLPDFSCVAGDEPVCGCPFVVRETLTCELQSPSLLHRIQLDAHACHDLLRTGSYTSEYKLWVQAFEYKCWVQTTLTLCAFSSWVILALMSIARAVCTAARNQFGSSINCLVIVFMSNAKGKEKGKDKCKGKGYESSIIIIIIIKSEGAEEACWRASCQLECKTLCKAGGQEENQKTAECDESASPSRQVFNTISTQLRKAHICCLGCANFPWKIAVGR